MSSALGVDKREGAQGSSPQKGEWLPVIKRFLYIFNKKSILNTLDVVFGEIFLLPHQQHIIWFKMCDQFCSQSSHCSCN